MASLFLEEEEVKVRWSFVCLLGVFFLGGGRWGFVVRGNTYTHGKERGERYGVYATRGGERRNDAGC